jgi:hypothetical protein
MNLPSAEVLSTHERQELTLLELQQDQWEALEIHGIANKARFLMMDRWLSSQQHFPGYFESLPPLADGEDLSRMSIVRHYNPLGKTALYTPAIRFTQLSQPGQIMYPAHGMGDPDTGARKALFTSYDNLLTEPDGSPRGDITEDDCHVVRIILEPLRQKVDNGYLPDITRDWGSIRRPLPPIK